MPSSPGGRRRPARAAIALAALLAATACAPRGHPEGPRNVLIIVSDTLRSDHLGFHGYHRPTSPQLDAFAREATVFVNAVAQAPSTKPSIASLFTGLYPSQHGAIDNEHALAQNYLTLAEILQSQGWVTGGFIENPVIGEKWGYGQGFETWYLDQRRHQRSEDTLEDFDALVADWVREHRAQRFFLYVHHVDPHSPYRAPKGYRGMFLPAEIDVGAVVKIGRRSVNVDVWASRYDEEIRYIDDRVAGLLGLFRELDLLDDSVVVFLSDHGEGFGEHGYVHHSYGVQGELLNIPMLIRAPGFFDAGTRADPATHVDLLPTLLSLLGIDHVVERSGGRSLLTPPRRPRLVVSEQLRGELGERQRAITDGEYKLIVTLDRAERSLHHRASDPLDLEDLLSENGGPVPAEITQRAAALERALTAWEARLGERVEAPTRELTPEEEAALRALGYVN